MARKKSRAQLEAEVDLARIASRERVFAMFFREVPKWLGLSVWPVAIAFSVYSLAGKATDAKIDLFAYVVARWQESSSLSFTLILWAFPWILTLIALIYARNMRNLMLEKTEHLTRRPGDLERMIDLRRSSSGLTTRGQTPLEEDHD